MDLHGSDTDGKASNLSLFQLKPTSIESWSPTTYPLQGLKEWPREQRWISILVEICYHMGPREQRWISILVEICYHMGLRYQYIYLKEMANLYNHFDQETSLSLLFLSIFWTIWLISQTLNFKPLREASILEGEKKRRGGVGLGLLIFLNREASNHFFHVDFQYSLLWFSLFHLLTPNDIVAIRELLQFEFIGI